MIVMILLVKVSLIPLKITHQIFSHMFRMQRMVRNMISKIWEKQNYMGMH